LRNSHELRIRWSTSNPYDGVAPFVSRVAPGAHVFWTPLADGGDDKDIGSVYLLICLLDISRMRDTSSDMSLIGRKFVA
jgi:hypothetical protein